MNRLMVARPLLRTIVQSNTASVARMSGGDHYQYEDIGPPASYNQLPQPEGDWTDAYNRKQKKYNAILGASVAFFVGTIVFVKESGIIFFNASPPDTYE